MDMNQLKFQSKIERHTTMLNNWKEMEKLGSRWKTKKSNMCTVRKTEKIKTFIDLKIVLLCFYKKIFKLCLLKMS